MRAALPILQFVSPRIDKVCPDLACRPSDAYRIAGFTLIEVIIAMVLIAIMLGIAVPAMLGARHGADGKQALSGAMSFDDAIQKFQHERGGRPPRRAEFGPNMANGPLGLNGTPYLKVVPEVFKKHIHGAKVTFDTAPTTAALKRDSYIVYVPLPSDADPKSYELRVYLEGENTTAVSCYLGDSGSVESLKKQCR